MTTTITTAEVASVAALIVAHDWVGIVGRSHDDPGGIRWACTCGHESSIDGMSGHASWRAAHALHAAERLLAIHIPGQPAPAVKPGREEIARALWMDQEPEWDTLREWAVTKPDMDYAETLGYVYAGADAVLALLPGRTEAEVKAEALREASDAWSDWDAMSTPEVWLDDRADALERGEGR